MPSRYSIPNLQNLQEMRTQKIQFDGITIEVPKSDSIKIHSYGMYEKTPLYAVVVFYFPSISQVSIHKYSEAVYNYASESISKNEFHVKTIFIL